MSKEIIVNTSSHDYPILITNCDETYKKIGDYIKGDTVLVITNNTIAPLYLKKIVDSLSDNFAIHVCQLQDGEQFKNQESINIIYDALIEKHCNRDITIVALGGGVVGDMAGFAAASFMRGVSFIQIPTTLLSQVDSSVGGKTGINHRLGKNMIGAFWQPRFVLANMNTLSTLPSKEFSAGMAEVVKYALIMDIEFLSWLETNIEKVMNLDHEALEYIVHKCCTLKAQVVKEDEREAGKRALLNFGHTFGHVIETYCGYGEFLHGEAVSIGMLQAVNMSMQLGWLTQHDVDRVKALLLKCNLPVNPPNIPVNKALELMSHDKKTVSGMLRLILLRKLGHAVVTSDFPQSVLQDVLKNQNENK